MAELQQIKQYDLPVGIPNVDKERVYHTPEPPLKKSRGVLNKVSLFEKFVAFLIIACVIGLAVATIQVRTAITQKTEEVSTIENKIIDEKSEISKLQQEKSELSRFDRLKQIADEAGLTSIEENIRKVNP